MVAILPSDLALLASFTFYRLVHRYADGPHPSLSRLSAVIKGTSTLHSGLSTILTIYFLHQCRTEWLNAGSQGVKGVNIRSRGNIAGPGDSRRGIDGTSAHGSRYPDDSTNPLLQTRSTFGNAITAVECGYLLQDTISLLREARLRFRFVQPSSEPTLRSILGYADKTLLIHHLGISLALLVLHYYIHQDRDRGIYIIVQFLLMNSSTPILNLRWWLRAYHPSSKMLCLGSDVAFIAAFYMARVWLVGWILRGYGKSHGYDSAWKVYWKGIRLPCQMGTGALWVANTTWWALLVISVAKRLPVELRLTGKEIRLENG